MVNRAPERKPDADYSLQRVAELASCKAVCFASTSVQRDSINLGYDQIDVCECMQALRPVHFSHAERYRPHGPWHDVYKIDWAPQGCEPDPLYVKFRMDDGLVVIELCSFHRQRFL